MVMVMMMVIMMVVVAVVFAFFLTCVHECVPAIRSQSSALCLYITN